MRGFLSRLQVGKRWRVVWALRRPRKLKVVTLGRVPPYSPILKFNGPISPKRLLKGTPTPQACVQPQGHSAVAVASVRGGIHVEEFDLDIQSNWAVLEHTSQFRPAVFTEDYKNCNYIIAGPPRTAKAKPSSRTAPPSSQQELQGCCRGQR